MMNRTISITALQEMDVNTWSVKDDSLRGMRVAYTSEIKPGDMVVIDNYFMTVTEAEEPAQETIKPEAVTVNTMCLRCDQYGGSCIGTTEHVWTGCTGRHTIASYYMARIGEALTTCDLDRIASDYQQLPDYAMTNTERETVMAELRHRYYCVA